jgi:hypothetical protein
MVALSKEKFSTKFLPDPGSLSTKLSGNYISRETLNTLVSKFSVKMHKEAKHINVNFPTELGDVPTVEEYVYFYLEYK